MLFKNNSNHYISLLLSIFLLFIISIYQINNEDLWFDELITLWIVNPIFTNTETYQNVINYENTPPLYYFLLKNFFYLSGYNYELLRLPNIIFNVISIVVFFNLLKKFSENNYFIFISLMLFALNYFLTSYSLEGRVYSFYCFISLCFINSYIGLINNKKNLKVIKFLYFLLFSLILFNTFIFSLIIFCTIFIFEFLFKNKNKRYYFVNLILIFVIFTSLILNFDFYKSIMSFKAILIENPNLDFYLFNFYFKQFFGSKIMGYTFFLYFAISVFLIMKKKLFDEKIIFLIMLIFFSYAVPIIYGFIFTPVIQDKYIIYVVPVILLISSLLICNIRNNKIKLSTVIFLITISFGNQLLKISKNEIDKPQFINVLKKLNDEKESKIFVSSFASHDNKFYNQIVDNYIVQIIELNKLNLKRKKLSNKIFWVICYDPSNTFKNCIENNILLNNKKNILKTITTYQVAAILINQQ